MAAKPTPLPTPWGRWQGRCRFEPPSAPERWYRQGIRPGFLRCDPGRADRVSGGFLDSRLYPLTGSGSLSFMLINAWVLSVAFGTVSAESSTPGRRTGNLGLA